MAARLCVIAGLLAATGAFAQEGALLGLPFGRPLDRALKRCPANDLAQVADWCGIDESVSLKRKSGVFALRVPRHDSGMHIPGWVHLLRIRLDEGKIVQMTAFTSGPDEQDRVIQSVSSRFGKPTYQRDTPTQNGFGARWIVKDTAWQSAEGTAMFTCGATDSCSVVFRTADEERRADERAKANRRSDKL